MDRRQTIYRKPAHPRRIVVPPARGGFRVSPRPVLVAAEKPQVVVVAPARSTAPVSAAMPASAPVSKKAALSKSPKGRVTIDSFSNNPPKTAAKKPVQPAKVTSARAMSTKATSPNPPHEQTYAPIHTPTHAPTAQHQPVYQPPAQHQPHYQPIPAHPVQSIQYHNHYYAAGAPPPPPPVVQQPYPLPPAPSQYARAVVASQQQSQLPMPIVHQYPAVVGGAAAALPSAPKLKKSSSVKPYTDSMKNGLAKVKHKMNKPDLKYKPTDIMRYAIVTFFVIMASYLAFDTWNTNQKIQTVVSGDSASATDGQHAASADVENPPVASGVVYPDYSVADDMPRILTIPSLNLTARVSEVGLTNANKIDVPNDASFAGWYNGSAKIDSVGAAFLTGHYNGVDAGGVFDNLNKIQNGAKITVEMGDGSKLNYEVVNIENTPIAQVDMSKALSPTEGVMEGLNIMTCQGSWSASGFSHRLTVYSRRV